MERSRIAIVIPTLNEAKTITYIVNSVVSFGITNIYIVKYNTSGNK